MSNSISIAKSILHETLTIEHDIDVFKIVSLSVCFFANQSTPPPSPPEHLLHCNLYKCNSKLFNIINSRVCIHFRIHTHRQNTHTHTERHISHEKHQTYWSSVWRCTMAMFMLVYAIAIISNWIWRQWRPFLFFSFLFFTFFFAELFTFNRIRE